MAGPFEPCTALVGEGEGQVESKPCYESGTCTAAGACVCDDDRCVAEEGKDQQCYECNAVTQVCGYQEAGTECRIGGEAIGRCDGSGACTCQDCLCEAEFGECYNCKGGVCVKKAEGTLCGNYGRCSQNGEAAATCEVGGLARCSMLVVSGCSSSWP